MDTHQAHLTPLGQEEIASMCLESVESPQRGCLQRTLSVPHVTRAGHDGKGRRRAKIGEWKRGGETRGEPGGQVLTETVSGDGSTSGSRGHLSPSGL